jgi:hypothetical protein
MNDMAVITHFYVNGNVEVTGSDWTEPSPKLGIFLGIENGVTINLPTQPEDAAALLNNLIDTADNILATIPGHHARTTEPSNRQ